MLILKFNAYLKRSKLTELKKETSFWKLLGVFENETRIEIIKLLLQIEWRSLSDIQRELAKRKWKMTLPGVLKHMRELEAAGLVRRESGAFTEQPDARKTMYLLEGKERVEKIMTQLESIIGSLLKSSVTFSETAKLARRIQRMGSRVTKADIGRLKSSLAKCESEEIIKHLTEDERKKLKLWNMMLSLEQ